MSVHYKIPQHLAKNATAIVDCHLEFNHYLQNGPSLFFSSFDSRSFCNEEWPQIQKCFEHFKHKKIFIHVGIGGSSLGPEMLIDALGNNGDEHDCRFLFINNIDPDMLFKQLASLKLKQNVRDCLFYIVSKSGGTAETLATLLIIMQELEHAGIKASDFKDYFVFSTDPQKSELLELAQNYHIQCLSIPTPLGGRYSVLSSVGLFPALFAGIDCHELLAGAREFKNNFSPKSPVYSLGNHIFCELQTRQVDQTVFIPYSSKLKNFSAWFVQLWAESLGKKFDLQNKIVHQGLTPIPAYGATDQHSQMQLFVEGPRNKFFIFLNILKSQHDFKLQYNGELKTAKKLHGHNLSQLLQAEFLGTVKVFETDQRPYATIELEKLDAKAMGELILFFETLTVYVGHLLKVDPFNQPGVEAAKIYTYEFLSQLK